MQEWVNYMSRGYFEYAGMTVKVYKMDKQQTQMDELYGEAKTGRIYLPYFEIKALYNTNPWQNILDFGGFEEKEDAMKLTVNFEDMVTKIRGLKNGKLAQLYIKYSGKGIPYLEKINDTFNIYINSNIKYSLNLKDDKYNTVKDLASYINSRFDFQCRIEGKNDLSTNLINFNKTQFYNREIMIYSQNDIYKNVTDIIEMGDVIITDKDRLYEVTSTKPAGEFGWKYSLWQLDMEVGSVDKYNLPDNYINQVINNPHGLNKINME